MKLRFLVALPVAVALIAGPALATPAYAASHTKRVAKASAHAAKRRVPFTAVGSLTTADTDAGTATVAVRSGMRDLRGKTVTVAVTAGTKIRLDDAASTLAALPAGARVTVVGVRAGTVLTATKLVARTG